MPKTSTTEFTRAADGTLLLRQPNGSFQTVESGSNRARLSQLTEEEIETWAATDPDHPALDDAFWATAKVTLPVKEAISIKLDKDVLGWFREQGRGYQTRINSVLRRFVEAQRKAG